MQTKLLLLPRPRRVVTRTGRLMLPHRAGVVVDGLSADSIAAALGRSRGAGAVRWVVRPAAAADYTLRGWIDSTLPAQGYRLDVRRAGIELRAADAAGAFYGLCTLAQVLDQSAPKVPCLSIEDHPDFPVRGVLLYISGGKVPTMATLRALIDRLASWKVNQLQLGIEHTFAYPGHPQVWRGKSPLTPAEVRELDAHCRTRFIDLVPNQNSFGHLERWLRHRRYNHLAEDPRVPTSLCPTDRRSIQLVESMYDQLLPHFSSRLVNAGCDEVAIGDGRSGAACRRKGVGRVYLEFVLKIKRLLRQRGKTMLCWADILQNHPELIPELPRDLVLLEWHYESDHPFNTRCATIARAGLPFYVCPGTSSWNSIGGRSENCLANLVNAARNGLKHGAIGFLNTDWGDNGHWQCLPVSYLGFAYGAAVSWCCRANLELPVAEAVSLHALGDPSGRMGRLLYDMGRAGEVTGVHCSNGSPLFNALIEPLDNPGVVAWVRSANFERAREQVDRAMAHVTKVRALSHEAELALVEMRHTAALLKHSCRRARYMLGRLDGVLNDRAAARELRALLNDGRRLVASHKQRWRARYRPGGLSESAARMRRHLIDAYRSALGA